ncbi:Oxidoreductases acting on the CH-OH group of donors With NAD(+) or NADP(+) as acceptor [Sarracenia purpurea var. burkii]
MVEAMRHGVKRVIVVSIVCLCFLGLWYSNLQSHTALVSTEKLQSLPSVTAPFAACRCAGPHFPLHFSPFAAETLQVPATLDFSQSKLQKQTKMKKGVHPQMQWISYVTQSGRLMNVMMTKIHNVGKVYHIRARRQMAQSIGQIAKFKRRYGQKEEESDAK